MNTFGYVDLAEYLLSIRFELIANIERERRRERHAPSRRVGQRHLAEHDMMICMAALRAHESGANVPEHVAVFANAAVNAGMTQYGAHFPQNYFERMWHYNLEDWQHHILERDYCGLCGGLWVSGDTLVCECDASERKQERLRKIRERRNKKNRE